MQCSDCGYQLSPFDKDCPRCKTMSIKGTKPPTTPPIELNFDDHLIDRIEETKLKCTNCNNPLECGWLACPKCGIQFEAPVPQPSSGKSETAPLPTVAPSSRSPGDGIIVGLIMIIVLGVLIVNWNKFTKGIPPITSLVLGRNDNAVIQAAKDAACIAQYRGYIRNFEEVPTGGIEKFDKDCRAKLDSADYTYSITYFGDNSAEVLFFENGMTRDDVIVAKDNNGEWHPAQKRW